MSGTPFIFTRTGLLELDQRALSAFGIPILVLMENAGRAVAEAVLAVKPRAKSVLIATGAGNNGGDGLVAARHLSNAGVQVTVLLVGGREKFHDAAGVQLGIVEKMGITVEEGGRDEVRDWVVEGQPGDVIVDAIFGTGLSRNVEGVAKEVIEGLNASRRTIIAIDIPSGIDADSGEVLGAAVVATETVSFCGLKQGFENARKHVGKVVVADIGVPLKLLQELAISA